MPALVHRGEQPVEVGERAEHRVDVLVVADVVAVVVLRRAVDRRQPHDVDAELARGGRGGDSMPGQVADAVAVGVREAARVDLVDDRRLPPRSDTADTVPAHGRRRRQRPHGTRSTTTSCHTCGSGRSATANSPSTRTSTSRRRGLRSGSATRTRGTAAPARRTRQHAAPDRWHRAAHGVPLGVVLASEVDMVHDERTVVPRCHHDSPPHRIGPWLTDDFHSGKATASWAPQRAGSARSSPRWPTSRCRADHPHRRRHRSGPGRLGAAARRRARRPQPRGLAARHPGAERRPLTVARAPPRWRSSASCSTTCAGRTRAGPRLRPTSGRRRFPFDDLGADKPGSGAVPAQIAPLSPPVPTLGS